MLSTWGGSSRKAAQRAASPLFAETEQSGDNRPPPRGATRMQPAPTRHADSRLPSHSPGHPTAAGPWHHPPQPRLRQQPTLPGFWSHSPRRTSWRKLRRTCPWPACWSVIWPPGPLRTPGPTRKHSHSSAALAPAQPGGACGSPVAARKTVLCSSHRARFTVAVPVGNGEKPKHRAKMLGNQSSGRLPGVSGAPSPGCIRVSGRPPFHAHHAFPVTRHFTTTSDRHVFLTTYNTPTVLPVSPGLHVPGLPEGR